MYSICVSRTNYQAARFERRRNRDPGVSGFWIFSRFNLNLLGLNFIALLADPFNHDLRLKLISLSLSRIPRSES